jgi:hypothetical protein
MCTCDLSARTVDMAVTDQGCCRAPFENDIHRTVVAPWTDSAWSPPMLCDRELKKVPVHLVDPLQPAFSAIIAAGRELMLLAERWRLSYESSGPGRVGRGVLDAPTSSGT